MPYTEATERGLIIGGNNGISDFLPLLALLLFLSLLPYVNHPKALATNQYCHVIVIINIYPKGMVKLLETNIRNALQMAVECIN